jgi:hypothetical protein
MLLPALLAVGLGVIAFAVSGSAQRLADFPFNDAQSGAARVCLILDTRAPRVSVSCAHAAAPITGLPAGTSWQDVSVAEVGNVTGDQYGDIAVSDSAASFDGRAGAGVTWIVGKSRHQGAIDLAKLGSGGFEIGGAGAGDGASVEIDGVAPGTGDVTGDGLDSVLLTDPLPAKGVERDSGTVWVVSGTRSGRSVDLAHLGGRGFAIDSAADGTIEEAAILGSVNGSRVAAVGVQDTAHLGEDAVVYGSASGATVSLRRLGSRGFLISGLAPAVGGPIVGVGDENGDGVGDMLVGNPWSGGDCGPTSPITTEICPGAAYLIYGSRRGGNVNVHRLGARGYMISSRSGATNGLGSTVAAGGGAGRRDLLISDNSHVFVIFPRRGRDERHPLNLDRRYRGYQIVFPIASGIALGPADGPAIGAIGDINEDGIPDLLVQPPAPNANATDSYVVYGKRSQSAVNLARLGRGGFRLR